MGRWIALINEGFSISRGISRWWVSEPHWALTHGTRPLANDDVDSPLITRSWSGVCCDQKLLYFSMLFEMIEVDEIWAEVKWWYKIGWRPSSSRIVDSLDRENISHSEMMKKNVRWYFSVVACHLLTKMISLSLFYFISSVILLLLHFGNFCIVWLVMQRWHSELHTSCKIADCWFAAVKLTYQRHLDSSVDNCKRLLGTAVKTFLYAVLAISSTLCHSRHQGVTIVCSHRGR